MKALIVFAKEPVAGRVKTRLAKSISDDYALSLYKAFLQDTFNLVRSVDADLKILAWTSQDGAPEYLKSIADDFIMYQQSEGDLGERMHQAFLYAQDLGANKTVIIGSDSPTLPKEYIEQSFDMLNNQDMVIGPTPDGGYYLIGLKETHELLFIDTTWSVPTTRIQTLKKAYDLNKKTYALDEWFDVDEEKDLETLKLSCDDEGCLAVCTKKILELCHPGIVEGNVRDLK